MTKFSIPLSTSFVCHGNAFSKRICLLRNDPFKKTQGQISVTMPSWDLPCLCYDSVFPSNSGPWLGVKPSLRAWHHECQITGSFYWSVICCSLSCLSFRFLIHPSFILQTTHEAPLLVYCFFKITFTTLHSSPPVTYTGHFVLSFTGQSCLDLLKP